MIPGFKICKTYIYENNYVVLLLTIFETNCELIHTDNKTIQTDFCSFRAFHQEQYVQIQGAYNSLI